MAKKKQNIPTVEAESTTTGGDSAEHDEETEEEEEEEELELLQVDLGDMVKLKQVQDARKAKVERSA